MAKVTINENILDNIADAIRTKGDTEALLRPSDMPAAINALPDGAVLEEKQITSNGVYVPSTGKNGFSQVTVNVSGGDLPDASGVEF